MNIMKPKSDPTDTPRTDAVFWKFHTHDDLVNLCRELERELSHSLANQLKTQAEVEKLRTLPESRHRAYLELLERAEKATADIERLQGEIEQIKSEIK